MNKILNVLLVFSLAIIFSIGMFLLVPKVNAEDENSLDIIDIYEVEDLTCPAVCVPMWIVTPENNCVFTECGSGCGVDYIYSYQTAQECVAADNTRQILIVDPIEDDNPVIIDPIEGDYVPIIDVPDPLNPSNVKMHIKFTPVEKQTNESNLIYDYSTMHIRIVSDRPINENEYVFSLKMYEVDSKEDNVIKNVYLKVRNNNFEVKGIAEGIAEESTTTNEALIEVDVSNANAQEYNKVLTTESSQGRPISKEVISTINNRRNMNSIEISNKPIQEKIKKISVYNYVVSFKDNQKEIENVFGKDYKDKEYIVEVILSNVSSGNEDRVKKVISAEKFFVQYSKSKTSKDVMADKGIIQEQVRTSREDISEERISEIKKMKPSVSEVKSLEGYDIYTDDSMTDMYISNNLSVRKLKPINDVLISNKINSEKIVGDIDLVSVDNVPEYVFKIREKRKLLGFIPFGSREKLVSLEATEEIEISE